MDNNVQGKNIPLALAKGLCLLFVYSFIFFFIFHYRTHDSSGSYLTFDFGLSSYVFDFIVCLLISVWMYKSHTFNKQAWKILLSLVIFAVIVAVVYFFYIYAYLAFLTVLVASILLAILINSVFDHFSENKKLSSLLAVIFGLLLLPTIYANNNDLSVKARVMYMNNEMFASVDDCNAYISPIRRADCKNDITSTQQRWFLQSNPILVPKQSLAPDSGNYEYFPQQNISDDTVGTGAMAKYGDTATISIVSATIQGKTYSHLKMNNPTLPDIYNNAQIKLTTDEKSYNSYALGIIGMRVGGTRDITFKSGDGYGFIFNGTPQDISVGSNDEVTYTIKLISLN